MARAGSPSSQSGAVLDMLPSPALERADATASVTFKSVDGATRLADLFQSGEAKIRFPRPEPGDPATAVFINTAGGMTGGDRFAFAIHLGEGARAVATTQACERIYRSIAGPVTVGNRVTVGAGATLDWLPQETILFDDSALSRRLEIEIAADARLTAVETILFGRTARGERVRRTALTDAWRIRRAGRLVYADTLALDGDATAVLARRATGAGAVAVASLIHAAPDAETRLDRLREIASTGGPDWGVSAFNGLVAIRLIDTDAARLRRVVVALVGHLTGRAIPRVWTC